MKKSMGVQRMVQFCRDLGHSMTVLALQQRALALGFGLLLAFAALADAQSWTPLTHQPTFYAGQSLLLTDGTVMVQQMTSASFGTGNWWRLTPDNTGSYQNGTWTAIASLPSGYEPLYYASAVLPDGRVIVEGGEYNVTSNVDTTLGAIYNPATNTWTAVTPPSGVSQIGDASSVILANGTFLLGPCCFQTTDYLLNPSTLTWTATGSTGKADVNSEEGWTLLPNGNVLTVDTQNGLNSELYNPSTGSWTSAGSTTVLLPAGPSGFVPEMGPAVLRPDGTVFATGGTSNIAVYNTATGTWSSRTGFTGGQDVADGPASLLPNGNVLVGASPGSFNPPTHFYEFDGTNLNVAPVPPRASGDSTFQMRMLVLPTGQILLTDGSMDVELYTPTGTYSSSWQPTINAFPATVVPGSVNNAISGWQFNGLSQGAMYGDDSQAATNYPLVRITNSTTGHVFYAKTHNHSTMAVATGAAVVSTQFDVPAGIESGLSQLEVVANGIPSNAVTLGVVGSVTAVNSASYAATVAADGFSSLFGQNLSLTTQSGSGNPLPTTLGGVSVTVAGSAARLSYVSPGLINLVLPSSVAAGTVPVSVYNNGLLVATGSAVVDTVAPGLFSADSSGSGLLAGNWQRFDSSGTQVAYQNTDVPIDFGAATDQVYLILYGTGIRHVSSLSAVSVTVGGLAGQVTYAGVQPTYDGLDQINVLLPRSLAGSGSGVPVHLTVDGRTANAVTVDIQ